MLRLRLRQFRKPESSLEFDLAPEVRRKSGHSKCARFSTPPRRLVDDDFELEVARTPQQGSGLVIHASIYVLCAAAASDQPRNARDQLGRGARPRDSNQSHAGRSVVDRIAQGHSALKWLSLGIESATLTWI